ncbi:hypothetical protein CA7LBN_001976 [Candidozyma auris]|uniref:Uncharacterized protein n=1 Tax=Candidozyma auris TaxID=498019 RepID=A0A8F3AGK2_CANAR|nr:hypothetical protein CA7LBN_001976 [[Candida] auris]
MSSETKPISTEEFKLALSDLTNENINSTNEYLEKEIEQTSDQESIDLYKETISENVEVMKNQSARLDAISEELSRRGVKPSKEEEQEGIYL